MKPTNQLKQTTLPDLMQLWKIYDKISDGETPGSKSHTYLKLIREEIDRRVFFGE